MPASQNYSNCPLNTGFSVPRYDKWCNIQVINPVSLAWKALMLSSLFKLTGYAVFGLAALLGPCSLAVFAWFLFTGSLDLVDLKMGEPRKLWFDGCLCMAFFVQHSTMIRNSFRKRLARLFPEAYSGAFYTIVSGIVLFLLIVFWQESDRLMAIPHYGVRWFLRALYFLSVAGFFWGVKSLGLFEPFGLRAICAHQRGLRLPIEPLAARGPYRWVRHPLYSCMLVMTWSCPHLTADRLLFDVLFTAWIIVGTFLEERDLITCYGDAYRNYQSEVPMLIPWRFWSRRYM
jgi:protein-S-isoprenylcysteine O-methyltransferase Ste14